MCRCLRRSAAAVGNRDGGLGSPLRPREIISQDPRVQLAQANAGIDADLLPEQSPTLLVDVERVRLPAAVMQREDQQPADLLPERVLGHQFSHLGYERRAIPFAKTQFEQLFGGAEAALLQAGG